jgi:hypothetical protein
MILPDRINMKKSAITSFFRLALSVVFCLVASVAMAQQSQSSLPAAKASIDSTSIKIGQQFHLTLQAASNPAAQLIWAEVPDSFNHLLVVTRGTIDTLKQPGRTVYTQRITLTGFDSGYWKIPAFDFRIVSGDTAAQPPSLQTDSLLIQVNTVPVDTAKPFRPIKEIRGVPFNILAYWPYILGALILLAILAYFIFFRKKRVVKKPEKKIPQEPPYDQALKSLHVLEEEKLWQQNKVKTYYTRLTDILRLYIERQYGINAMEQTSDELLQRIKPITKLNQQQNNLRYILQTADLAKFAKLQPSADEHEGSMRKAYEVLEWTKPREEEKEKEDETKTTNKEGSKPGKPKESNLKNRK